MWDSLSWEMMRCIHDLFMILFLSILLAMEGPGFETGYCLLADLCYIIILGRIVFLVTISKIPGVFIHDDVRYRFIYSCTILIPRGSASTRLAILPILLSLIALSQSRLISIHHNHISYLIA